MVVRFFQAIDQLVGNLGMRNRAPKRRAALSRSADRGKEDGANGEIEVGCRCDDGSVVAAELAYAATEASCLAARHVPAHRGTSGRGHDGDSRIIREHTTELLRSEQDRTQAIGSGAKVGRNPLEDACTASAVSGVFSDGF